MAGSLSLDRAAGKVLFALSGMVALAWIYVLSGAGLGVGMRQMDAPGGNLILMRPAWTTGYAILVFGMWVSMMVAMMLPSGAPTILMVTSLARDHSDPLRGMLAAIRFTAGYLVVWAGVSVAATLAQWGLDRAGLLSESMASRSATVAGLALLVAGLYQLTSLKQSCLRQCRSSLDRLAHDWRMSARTTIAAGTRHGLLCLGGCGVLMGLLFVGGVMNVSWIAGLTILVFVEQTWSWGSGVSRLTGAALIAWASVVLTTAVS